MSNPRVRFSSLVTTAISVLSSAPFGTTIALAAESPKLQASVKVSGTPNALQRFALAGDESWDYLTLDPLVRRLYISRSNRLSVYDVDRLEELGVVKDLEGVHGAALAPELKRGFASNGRANTVTFFALDDFHHVAEVKTGEHPDAIVFEPKSKRVLTFNASGSATVIDAQSAAVLGQVPLSGKPEFAVTDGTGHVFAPIEDRGTIVELDAVAMKVLHEWNIKPCEEPAGLAIDRKERRLFASCDNGLLAVINADTGKLVQTLKIGKGPDAVGFDPIEKTIFTANGGDGSISVLKQDSANHYHELPSIPTMIGARTLAIDDQTHRIFSVTAQFHVKPPPTPENPHPRKPIVPGSVTGLVVSVKTLPATAAH